MLSLRVLEVVTLTCFQGLWAASAGRGQEWAKELQFQESGTWLDLHNLHIHLGSTKQDRGTVAGATLLMHTLCLISKCEGLIKLQLPFLSH